MDVINAFTAPNPGRIDVAQKLGSVEAAMYIYDVDPGEGASWADGEDDWNKAV